MWQIIAIFIIFISTASVANRELTKYGYKYKTPSEQYEICQNTKEDVIYLKDINSDKTWKLLDSDGLRSLEWVNENKYAIIEILTSREGGSYRDYYAIDVSRKKAVNLNINCEKEFKNYFADINLNKDYFAYYHGYVENKGAIILIRDYRLDCSYLVDCKTGDIKDKNIGGLKERIGKLMPPYFPKYQTEEKDYYKNGTLKRIKHLSKGGENLEALIDYYPNGEVKKMFKKYKTGNDNLEFYKKGNLKKRIHNVGMFSKDSIAEYHHIYLKDGRKKCIDLYYENGNDKPYELRQRVVYKAEKAEIKYLKKDNIAWEKEAKLYKIKLQPKTPQKGIETGHVIAYGHYIKPPYKITVEEHPADLDMKNNFGEIESYSIFINEIQLVPPIVNPNLKISRHKSKVNYKKHRKIYKKIKTEYIKLEAIHGRDKAIKKVIKFAKKQSLIVDATETPPYIPVNRRIGDFFIKIKGYEKYTGISLHSERDDAEKIRHLLIDTLKNNKVEMVSFEKSITFVNKRNYTINEIMEVMNSKMVDRSKETALGNVLYLDFYIKSVLHNFDPTEWPVR